MCLIFFVASVSGAIFNRFKIAEILVVQLNLNLSPKTLALIMYIKARAKRGRQSIYLKVQEGQ